MTQYSLKDKRQSKRWKVPSFILNAAKFYSPWRVQHINAALRIKLGTCHLLLCLLSFTEYCVTYTEPIDIHTLLRKKPTMKLCKNNYFGHWQCPIERWRENTLEPFYNLYYNTKVKLIRLPGFFIDHLWYIIGHSYFVYKQL